LSRSLADGNITQSLTACGTPSWAAPEVLSAQRYSSKADVYSFGICLWEMCTRDKPFSNMTTPQVIIAVAREGKRLPTENVQPEFLALINMCWHAEPKCRPIFSEIGEELTKILLPIPLNEFPISISNRPLARQAERDTSERSWLLIKKRNWGPQGTPIKTVLGHEQY